MKYLKRFNEELKTSTYQSAADKLKKLGHVKRSTDIQNYTEILKKKEEDRVYQELIDDSKQLGVYQMKISGYNSFEGNFYITFYLTGDDRLNDDFNNWIEHQGSFWIQFDFGIIPADEETKEKMIKYKIETYKGVYWPQSMDIHMSDPIDMSSPGYNISPSGRLYFERYDDGKADFANRKSALQFKKALIDIFEGRIIIRETDKAPGGVKGILMDELCTERDIEFKDFLKFIESLKKININSLYKD